MINAALEYLDQGYSVFPVSNETKKPLIKWKEFQDRQPTEDEVTLWWGQWPDASIAVITGEISGVVVVDCDTEDAERAATELGFTSPVRVKTKRGIHHYWSHPGGGQRFGPRVGGNSRGDDWPKQPGLDFRGDGSYALLPPSKGYAWQVAEGWDIEDAPTWQGWSPPSKTNVEPSGLDLLDLAGVTSAIGEWERTRLYVARENGGKPLPTGGENGRNNRVTRYAGELVARGVRGDELEAELRRFMDAFFEEHLPNAALTATMKSIESADRRNHEDRYQEDQAQPQVRGDKPLVFTMSDLADIESQVALSSYYIEPWLSPGSIVQVYGYSGHGKSLVLQHILYALAAGQRYAGPFETMVGKVRPPRILYLDFEMGKTTVVQRLRQLETIYGRASDMFQLWTPWWAETTMSLLQNDGLKKLQDLLVATRPDILVIDTIRSAFPGMKENDAEAWGKVNALAQRIRAAGPAVIMVHHSNKPQAEGTMTYSGSGAQLAPLDTQLAVIGLDRDEDRAQARGARFSDPNDSSSTWAKMEKKSGPDFPLTTVVEIAYGKTRDWTDEHDLQQSMGFGETNDGVPAVVSSHSTKRRVQLLLDQGRTPEQIAYLVGRPLRVVRHWCGLAKSLGPSQV